MCYADIALHRTQRVYYIMASELMQFYKSIIDNGIVDIGVQQAIDIGVH